MNIVDANGNYALIEGTLRPQSSDHPVYQARIEMALYQGKWLWAPTAGSTLDRFKILRQTPARVDEFQKELVAYLSKYGPTVLSRLTGRNGVQYNLTIPKEALSGVLSST